ncbi:MAG: hypothetical protein IJU23_02800 [Proteobacteria bacterium]|nr:hypothetical protein [Pseudomonadota bacterium]
MCWDKNKQNESRIADRLRNYIALENDAANFGVATDEEKSRIRAQLLALKDVLCNRSMNNNMSRFYETPSRCKEPAMLWFGVL